jgi:drug/metabolite transporter (DMT)-like permease
MTIREAVSAPMFGVMLVAVCAVFEGFAQVCYKKAAHALSRKTLWVVGGTVLFAIEAGFYTLALRFLDLSIAYPLGALSFVAVALLSHGLLHERISPSRWIGVVLILVGVTMVVLRGA